MISWLQYNLQKHFRFVFIILLAVIIVSFVFTIGAAPGIGDGRGERMKNLKFFDYELDTEAKREVFRAEGFWSAYMQSGNIRLDPNQLSNYFFNRATTLYLANLHRIPNPTPEQVQEYIKELPLFMNAQGEFDPQAYARFTDEIAVSGSITQTDALRIISDDYRITKVNETLTGPGFVLPEEVLSDLRQDQTKWTVAVAEWDQTTYNPQIDTTTEMLAEFYASNSFRYATPERRIVSYIEFRALDFKDQVSPSDEDLKSYFEENKAKYEPAESSESEESEEEATEVDFETVREKVVFDYSLEMARQIAQNKAEALVLAIVESESNAGGKTPREEIVANVLAAQGLTSKDTIPFSNDGAPIGLSWSRNTVNTAFQLNESLFYSEPIQEGDTTIVLLYKDLFPQTIPEMETVRARVDLDYKEEELRRLRSEQGKALQAKLSESADSIQEFQETAEGEGLTVNVYQEFTRREPPSGLDRSLAYSTSSLAEGDVSEMITQGDKGSFVYIIKKDAPELQAEGEEYEARIESLKTAYSRYAVSQYIGKLMNEELERSGLAAN